MKRSTRLIIFIAVLAVLVVGWFVIRNNFRDQMQEALTIRYPMDTFEVNKVRFSIVPPGAVGSVHAVRDDVDFEVQVVKSLISFSEEDKKEDQVIDNYYEMRSINHYEELLAPQIEMLENSIEAYRLEPIVIGEHSFNASTGYYPITVHFLLSEDVQTAEEFVDTVHTITQQFRRAALAGVDGYYFSSFPGSVLTSDLSNIGYSEAWLTEPSPTPTPSPTPGATTTGTGTEVSTSETTTLRTTTERSSKPLAPAFAYKIAILDSELDMSKALIKNGMRTISHSERELIELANAFDLNRNLRNKLGEARELQSSTRRNSGSNPTSTTR